MNKRNIFFSIFWIVLGIALVVCHTAGLIESFWYSMGIAFVIVGILQAIRYLRYLTNQEYREKFDVEVKDERNRFISSKAWAWSGYLFIIITAIGTIAFKLMGRDDLMMLCSGGVCLMLLLYWGSYMILRRKY